MEYSCTLWLCVRSLLFACFSFVCLLWACCTLVRSMMPQRGVASWLCMSGMQRSRKSTIFAVPSVDRWWLDLWIADANCLTFAMYFCTLHWGRFAVEGICLLYSTLRCALELKETFNVLERHFHLKESAKAAEMWQLTNKKIGVSSENMFGTLGAVIVPQKFWI